MGESKEWDMGDRRTPVPPASSCLLDARKFFLWCLAGHICFGYQETPLTLPMHFKMTFTFWKRKERRKEGRKGSRTEGKKKKTPLSEN